MALISLPNTISSGDTDDPTRDMANWNVLLNLANGAIDNENIAANAAIVASKLDLTDITSIRTNNNVAYKSEQANSTAVDILKLGTDNILKLSQLRRQVGAGATNATVSNQTIQFGYSAIGGNDTGGIAEVVTFPTAFDDTNIAVTANFAGSGTWGSTAGSTVFFNSIHEISTTGFTINLGRTSGSFASGTSYWYTWIAIGTLA